MLVPVGIVYGAFEIENFAEFWDLGSSITFRALQHKRRFVCGCYLTVTNIGKYLNLANVLGSEPV